MVGCQERLTARTPSAGSLVLALRLFARAVQRGLLAAGAFGFLGADAAAVAAAAGGGDGCSGGRHYSVF